MYSQTATLHQALVGGIGLTILVSPILDAKVLRGAAGGGVAWLPRLLALPLEVAALTQWDLLQTLVHLNLGSPRRCLMFLLPEAVSDGTLLRAVTSGLWHVPATL